jgi:hypothetical protein
VQPDFALTAIFHPVQPACGELVEPSLSKGNILQPVPARVPLHTGTVTSRGLAALSIFTSLLIQKLTTG